MSAYVLASTITAVAILGYTAFLKIATGNAPYCEEPDIDALALAFEADERRRLARRQLDLQVLDSAYTLDRAA